MMHIKPINPEEMSTEAHEVVDVFKRHNLNVGFNSSIEISEKETGIWVYITGDHPGMSVQRFNRLYDGHLGNVRLNKGGIRFQVVPP